MILKELLKTIRTIGEVLTIIAFVVAVIILSV